MARVTEPANESLHSVDVFESSPQGLRKPRASSAAPTEPSPSAALPVWKGSWDASSLAPLTHYVLWSPRLAEDVHFDEIFPRPLADRSAIFWTPVHVAKAAASWLTAGGAKRVLDVGAGVGKFCVVGASNSPAEFIGLEQRPQIAAVANQVIDNLNLTNARVIVGSVAEHMNSDFDAYYFFNPFGEAAPYGYGVQVFQVIGSIDRRVDLSAEGYKADVAVVQAALANAKVGTRVATYCGMGGDMPASYGRAFTHPRIDRLEFWEKHA